jgi:hypothetical protein
MREWVRLRNGSTHPGTLAPLVTVTALVAALLLGVGTTLQAAPRAVIQGEAGIDAGEVEPSQILEHEFVLRNEGDKTLVIADLKPTCYCISAETNLWDVPPGGEARIAIRIDPSDFVGKVDKGIEIESNDPENPVLMIHVKFVILPGIAVVPPELDFGNVGPEGTKKSKKVDVKAPRERSLEILDVSTDADFVSVTHEDLLLEERDGVSVFVKILPQAPPGPFTAKVTVHTSDASTPTIEIPLRGSGAGGLRAEPERVLFESAPAGSEVGSFEVSGASDLVVRSSVASLRAEIEPSKGDVVRVKLHLAENARAGRLLAKVTVSARDGSQPELTVPVMGIVR